MEEQWKELAIKLGWDGETESGMKNVIQNWQCIGPAKEGGILFRKRAGIDGNNWPPENLYVVVKQSEK